MATLPERLRALRAAADKKQIDVAQAVGVTASSLGYYENGKADPSSTTLSALADYYRVSVDYLLGKTDIPDRPPVKVLGTKIPVAKRLPYLEKEIRSSGYSERDMALIMSVLKALAADNLKA